MRALSTTLMTGASRGFGRRAAEEVLRTTADRHLVVAVRGGSGERIAAELGDATGNEHVSALECDLASLSSVRNAGATLNAKLGRGDLPPLTGFVGNAGLQIVGYHP